MAYVIVLVLLVAIIYVVGTPLLRTRPAQTEAEDDALRERAAALERGERRIDLEAARDAKYREIRDSNLDHQTGKLSDADFAAINSTLRAEASELLQRLDELDAGQEAQAAADAQAGAERLPSPPR